MDVNNYTLLLEYHSNYRWVAITTLMAHFLWTFYKKYKLATFSTKDLYINIGAALIISIQGIMGLWLYSISPIVQGFIDLWPQSIHERQLRFFGLEHIFMMLLGILLLWRIAWKSRKQIGSSIFFQKQFKMYLWIIIIILSSVPWSFSPLTSRPNFR